MWAYLDILNHSCPFLQIVSKFGAVFFFEKGSSPKENSFELYNGIIFCIMHAVAYPRVLFAFLKWAEGLSYHQKWGFFGATVI